MIDLLIVFITGTVILRYDSGINERRVFTAAEGLAGSPPKNYDNRADCAR